MKTFKIKNYGGNLVESLKRFAESHKDLKIVEAKEVSVSDNDEVKFSIDWDMSNQDATEYFDSEKEVEEYWNDIAKEYGMTTLINWSGSAGGSPEVFFKGPRKNLEKFIYEYLANNDAKEYAKIVEWINEMNDCDFDAVYGESTAKSEIYIIAEDAAKYEYVTLFKNSQGMWEVYKKGYSKRGLDKTKANDLLAKRHDKLYDQRNNANIELGKVSKIMKNGAHGFDSFFEYTQGGSFKTQYREGIRKMAK